MFDRFFVTGSSSFHLSCMLFYLECWEADVASLEIFLPSFFDKRVSG